uniref:Neuron navigator 3 n=1 Tax=Xiphophorus couchianus TaxID=32473 RepID=A0A3B5M9T7_9TELE
MPVVGVASKLRQPSVVGTKPVHTALPIPSAVRAAASQGFMARQRDLGPGDGTPALNCQLSVRSEYQQERRTAGGKARAESEESKICKIYTDWANHYLAKSGCPRLIKDLSQDVTDGVLLAQIIQIIAKEKVEDINGSPRSQSQMIENVDACLSFLDARGVNVQGLSAEEIRNGNLKSILGLFFILSRYKQQQQQQQQYYQSLVELSQQTSSTAPSTSSLKTQEMQSSLTARYASPPGHSGIGPPQKKNTRLPGPARVPAAGSGASRSPGSSNLNRRSQSFNSIDKSKPLQYASGNDRESVRGIPVPSGMNGSGIGGMVPTSLSGQQLASAIPSPTAGKSWRSKSMNLKHSATSSMLASPTHSPSTTPSPQALEGLQTHGSEASKVGSGAMPPQRSMLEKFRLINPRSASRASPSMAEMTLQEEDDLSEYGDDGKTSSSSSSKTSASGSRSLAPCKDKEDKNKSGKSSKDSSPPKEERENASDSTKKTSKIASLIPKGGKSSSGKKDGGSSSASSGIPKPGLKAPSMASAKPQSEGERAKLTKGGQGGSFYIQHSAGGPEGKRTSMTSSTSTSALSGSSGMLVGGGGALGGNGVVQLPQQQQHNHPNTATVAPFMYRTFSENDCTMVAPADPCLSPTKGELVYSKTAKQCLEEISGEDPETRRMRTVKNIADLRQNLEETMSSLRGTQISHSTLETTFDTTVTTEVNGRSLPALAARSSPMAWRLGQSQTPRLQAGEAPSMPSGYPAPRSKLSIHRYLTDSGLHLYGRTAGRSSDVTSPREIAQRGSKEIQVHSGFVTLRYPPSSRQTSHEEGKEWLRSHSTGGLQDTGSQSPLSPPGAACINTGKYHYSNLLSPTNINQYNLPPGNSGSMSRSNSIPAQDSFDLYGEGHPLGGSATSLEDRPRAISRSGSFRDSTDEVHGSSLSLVSSTSSLYSAQIRKLRRELDASQEKVATLTSQLSANAHLVAAFEKSLSNMTCRLQSLTMTAEQKESELAELRETIEMLKTQNTDAQTAIQVALNGPDHLHKDLRIRRQHSSESMSSINSAASHASMGSLGKDAEDKKKKKKSWVSGKKKKKKEISMRITQKVTLPPLYSPALLPPCFFNHRFRLCECTEAEAEIILQLKNELREKELKLTDIRLEALSSAHHLDQIREAMNRMQNEIETLKAENDRLKSSGNATPTATPIKMARPPSEASSTSSSSSRQSLGLSLNNLNITDTIMSDILLDDSYEGNLRKESRSVRIVVTISSGPKSTKVPQSHEYLIGSIGVSGKTKWDVLDGVIRRLFKEYVFRVDPGTSLGLSSDSIVGYRMGEVIRCHASEVPELLPCGYLVGDNNIIKVHLKGVKENSIDSLVFDTLIPKPIIQRYLNLLMEHRRIILSGPSGTGKSFLAAKLAEYIISQMGQEVTEHNVASFNVDQNSSKVSETHSSSDLMFDFLPETSGNTGMIFNPFYRCNSEKCGM